MAPSPREETSSATDSEFRDLLQQFHVTEEYGFLLANPLTRLSEQFEPWHKLCDELPNLIEESPENIRPFIQDLPVLSISSLSTHEELRLTHLVLSTLTSAFLWADRLNPPPSVLPRCIAIPFVEVAEKLRMRPVVCHGSICIANWKKGTPFFLNNNITNSDCDPDHVLADRIDLISFRFLKTSGNTWFFSVTAQIEYEFAPALAAIVRACTVQRKLGYVDEALLDRSLTDIKESLKTMAASLKRMRDHLSPSEFYVQLRPYLWGYSQVEGGVIFEGLEHLGPLHYAGATAAQSSTAQAVDAFLGIRHTGTDGEFLIDQRQFMPGGHRDLLEWVENTVHEGDRSLFSQLQSRPLLEEVFQALKLFRSAHINTAALFILTQIKKAENGEFDRKSEAGTGGTPFMQFLKAVREDCDKVLQ